MANRKNTYKIEQQGRQKFEPQLAELFGPEWIHEPVIVPQTAPGMCGTLKADYLYPHSTPALLIEYKSTHDGGNAARGRHEVTSYVADAHYFGRLTGPVIGILAEHRPEWAARTFNNGQPTSPWYRVAPEMLANIVVPGEPIGPETVAYWHNRNTK